MATSVCRYRPLKVCEESTSIRNCSPVRNIKGVGRTTRTLFKDLLSAHGYYIAHDFGANQGNALLIKRTGVDHVFIMFMDRIQNNTVFLPRSNCLAPKKSLCRQHGRPCQRRPDGAFAHEQDHFFAFGGAGAASLLSSHSPVDIQTSHPDRRDGFFVSATTLHPGT